MIVYILFSEISSKYYVGQTVDLVDRLVRHNGGRVLSAKSGTPWRVVRQFPVEGRSEALKLELRIKKRGAKRFLEDLERKHKFLT